MTILFGVLLYVLCIAFLCALTGMNRLGEDEPKPRHLRESAIAKPMAPPARVQPRVPAREAHG